MFGISILVTNALSDFVVWTNKWMEFRVDKVTRTTFIINKKLCVLLFTPQIDCRYPIQIDMSVEFC